MIPDDAGDHLLALARAAIRLRLAGDGALPEAPGWALADAASFVTLHTDGALRGCIGSLVAHRPLCDDVAGNAVAAAFRDPRFQPVTAEEEPGLHVEVSVLGAPEPLVVASREEARRALRPGVDGLVLTAGAHRATFLPQVWDQLPDPDDFLSHLLAKAGLPANSWPDGIALETYGVRSWEE